MTWYSASPDSMRNLLVIGNPPYQHAPEVSIVRTCLNHRHQLFGHVLSGRYKSQVVEGSGNGYLRTACDLRASQSSAGGDAPGARAVAVVSEFAFCAPARTERCTGDHPGRLPCRNPAAQAQYITFPGPFHLFEPRPRTRTRRKFAFGLFSDDSFLESLCQSFQCFTV
jgi:hypothetical protein